MSELVACLSRFDAQLPAVAGAAIDLAAAVPLFHRWIHEQDAADMLINVADYRHVPGHPAVVLITSAGAFCLAAGVAGTSFSYRRRRPFAAKVGGAARWRAVLQTLGEAALRLQAAWPDTAWVRDRIEVVLRDRLLVTTAAEARQPVAALVQQLCGDVQVTAVAPAEGAYPRLTLAFGGADSAVAQLAALGREDG